MRSMRIVLVLGLALSLLGLALRAFWTSSFEVTPGYQNDLQLSQYPIIVVGTWDKSPFLTNKLVKGNLCREFEVFTELNVQRVIKGDIMPGIQTILFGREVSWSDDGTQLGMWTMDQMEGDVADVTKPNIWFLNTKRSWDESDRRLYYHLPDYRAVQPLVLEPYFAAINSFFPKKEVPKQLSSNSPLVLERTLRYICGGILPWPDDPDGPMAEYFNPKERGEVLREHAAQVRDVVTRDVGHVRALAASVYAELADKESVGFMRTLLTDKDANVRATAIGILAKHRDEASINGMAQAVVGVEDGWMACRVIDMLSSWGDRRLVPILTAFLENDTLSYQYDLELGIPAVKAREAIAKITGHWFPFDVAASARAWKEVKDIEDPQRQTELLQQLLPGSQCPVVAELVGSPRYYVQPPDDETSSPVITTWDRSALDENANVDAMVTVRVRNTTNQDVVIAKVPTKYLQYSPSGFSEQGLGALSKSKAKEAFVSLKPGESVRFEVSLTEGFLRADPPSRYLKLTYCNMSHSADGKAWIGLLMAHFGSEWKEERKLEEVKERWPNGNVKAVGQTMNGQKHGQWSYFNEEGDLIREANYSDGSAQAEYYEDSAEAGDDPEQAGNQRAGRENP